MLSPQLLSKRLFDIRSHTSSCNFWFFFIAGEHFPNVEDCGHRTLVDFLDLLWSPLKKVESYSQLCCLWKQIFHTLSQENIRPYVQYSIWILKTWYLHLRQHGATGRLWKCLISDTSTKSYSICSNCPICDKRRARRFEGLGFYRGKFAALGAPGGIGKRKTEKRPHRVLYK